MLLRCVEDHIDRVKYPGGVEIPQMKKNRHLSITLNQQAQDQAHRPDYSELSHWHYDKSMKWHIQRQKEKKLLRKA